MMKPIISISICLSALIHCTTLRAQSKIKDGTVSPSTGFADTNAILELESGKRGLLLPRVSLSATTHSSPLSAHLAGMTVYNTATAGTAPDNVQPGYYYNDGNKWIMLGSREPWQSTRTHTGATNSTDSVYILGSAGIGTATPQRTLHINGAMQLTGELNAGGTGSTAGSAGRATNVLTSNGSNNAPSWKPISALPSTSTLSYYLSGTSEITVNAGDSADIPGLRLTYTVPAGMNQTLLFTVTGYAQRSLPSDDQAAQGVFSLYQDAIKISSAYAASGDVGDLLTPFCTTLLKAVALGPGTYTFKVQYKSWHDDQLVNVNPTGFPGYTGDVESMLTKMIVLVYNN